MKKYSLILLLFLCLTASILWAQDDNVNTEIDKEKKADILLLLKLSGTSDFAYIIVDDVVANYKQFITNTPEDYWDKLLAETDISPFNKAVIDVYDKRFTKNEIKQLIQFFQSEVGNKWALSLKDMNDEVMMIANQFGQDIYKSINQKLIEDGYINQPEIEQEEPTENK